MTDQNGCTRTVSLLCFLVWPALIIHWYILFMLCRYGNFDIIIVDINQNPVA